MLPSVIVVIPEASKIYEAFKFRKQVERDKLAP